MKTIKNYNEFVNELVGFAAETEMETPTLKDTIKKGVASVKNFIKGEVTREKAIEILNSHAMRKRIYERLLKNEPEKAEKLVEFIMEYPNAVYFTWNEEDGKFEETGYSSMRENKESEEVEDKEEEVKE